MGLNIIIKIPSSFPDELTDRRRNGYVQEHDEKVSVGGLLLALFLILLPGFVEIYTNEATRQKGVKTKLPGWR